MSKRILVVEDQEDNRQILRDLLCGVGYDMSEAWDGEAGVAAAKEQRPDLILMDIQLPLLDGYEATRRIKGDPDLKGIPVIVVTSYALSGDEGKAAKLQAEAKAKLKSAFDRLSPALKANKESPELQLAFADYYRAQRLPSSMNRYLAPVMSDPRAAAIQAMAASQEEEGAEKAIPMLKA